MKKRVTLPMYYQWNRDIVEHVAQPKWRKDRIDGFVEVIINSDDYINIYGLPKAEYDNIGTWVHEFSESCISDLLFNINEISSNNTTSYKLKESYTPHWITMPHILVSMHTESGITHWCDGPRKPKLKCQLVSPEEFIYRFCRHRKS